METAGWKRAGATQKNFFLQIFTSNPKIKLLYIFNTYALQCSVLNLQLHGQYIDYYIFISLM